MNSIKGAHESQNENSRDEQGGSEGQGSRWSTTDPWRYRCATLITKKSTTVWAPRSEHAGSGKSELPNEWYDEMPSGVQRQAHVYR